MRRQRDRERTITTNTAHQKPPHLHAGSILLVFLGGAIGAAVRYLISAAVPDWQGMSVATFAINVTGAFLLGLLLEGLVRHGPDTGARRALRLFAGTGILGGYTTYSTFAVGTDGLIAAGQLWASVGYGLATVVVGALASFAGIALAAGVHRARLRRARG